MAAPAIFQGYVLKEMKVLPTQQVSYLSTGHAQGHTNLPEPEWLSGESPTAGVELGDTEDVCPGLGGV